MSMHKNDKKGSKRTAGRVRKNVPRLTIRRLASQQEKRRKQLRLIQDFFSNPPSIDLKDDLIPSSSTREEIEQRKSELQYRIALLKALLEVVQSELELLSRAEMAETDDGGT